MTTGKWSMTKITALKPVFQFYWKKVFLNCLFYAKDYNTAKDLTQNIFLDMWERNVSFEDKESLNRYLTKCAKYQVLNYLRYTKRNMILPTEELPDTPRYDYNPESLYSHKELNKHLEIAIDSLNEPSRTVFLMSRAEQLTYRAISNKLGISVSTVEYHMSKALSQLRDKIRLGDS